jgi:hypothetical protein
MLGDVADMRVLASHAAWEHWFIRFSLDVFPNMAKVKETIVTGWCRSILDFMVDVPSAQGPTMLHVVMAFDSMCEVYRVMYGSTHVLSESFREIAEGKVLMRWYRKCVMALTAVGWEAGLAEYRAAGMVATQFNECMDMWQTVVRERLTTEFHTLIRAPKPFMTGVIVNAIRVGGVIVPNLYETYVCAAVVATTVHRPPAIVAPVISVPGRAERRTREATQRNVVPVVRMPKASVDTYAIGQAMPDWIKKLRDANPTGDLMKLRTENPELQRLKTDGVQWCLRALLFNGCKDQKCRRIHIDGTADVITKAAI